MVPTGTGITLNPGTTTHYNKLLI